MTKLTSPRLGASSADDGLSRAGEPTHPETAAALMRAPAFISQTALDWISNFHVRTLLPLLSSLFSQTHVYTHGERERERVSAVTGVGSSLSLPTAARACRCHLMRVCSRDERAQRQLGVSLSRQNSSSQPNRCWSETLLGSLFLSAAAPRRLKLFAQTLLAAAPLLYCRRRCLPP